MGRSRNTAKKSIKSTTQQATCLLEKWARLARSHIATSGGCSCGGSHPNLQIQDFEQDILDHLFAKYAADDEIAALLREHARNDPNAGVLSHLLRAIAEGEGPASGPAKQQLLAELARSLDSFEQLHRGYG